MLCWSCGKEIADGAVRCSHCEAEVTALPSDSEIETARQFLENMDPELRFEMLRVFETSKSGEEFVNRIMVGECPKCGSDKTGDCENDPDIEDVSMGRCFECGYVWCTVCDTPYMPGQDRCETCEELDDELDDWADDEVDDWADDDFDEHDETRRLDRYHLLAAEIFNYSFANYRNHLGIDHVRFETWMPDDARLLERAVNENWPAARVAEVLRTRYPEDFVSQAPTEQQCEKLLESCRQALQVVDAETPAESFRHAVRQCIQHAMENGLDDAESVEALVTQICYRVSDLSVLLERDGDSLARYCKDLRR
ncbi:MAG: hypothetical protein ACQESR_02175 [Planctomycetota bacterium]